jgi:hypothetical protein
MLKDDKIEKKSQFFKLFQIKQIANKRMRIKFDNKKIQSRKRIKEKQITIKKMMTIVNIKIN